MSRDDVTRLEESMKLPEGRTCQDCRNFGYCRSLFSCEPTNVSCDWSPSRFQPRPAEKDLVQHLPSNWVNPLIPTEKLKNEHALDPLMFQQEYEAFYLDDEEND